MACPRDTTVAARQIGTGDLTIESPWSYPLSHNSSVDRAVSMHLQCIETKFYTYNMRYHTLFSLQSPGHQKTTSNFLRINLKGKSRFNSSWPLEGALYITRLLNIQGHPENVVLLCHYLKILIV